MICKEPPCYLSDEVSSLGARMSRCDRLCLIWKLFASLTARHYYLLAVNKLPL